MLKSKQSYACSYSALVSIRHDFKSHAATVADPDQNPSGIMLYCCLVWGCTCLGPLVSSKIKPHDSLPRAGFSEARESQSLVERRKDKCKGPKGMKHEHFFRFLFVRFFFSLREISVKKGAYYNEKFPSVPAHDLWYRSVLTISLNVARQWLQWLLLRGCRSLSLKKRSLIKILEELL